jgi:uncharacterized protein (UPF0333 family)
MLYLPVENGQTILELLILLLIGLFFVGLVSYFLAMQASTIGNAFSNIVITI